jgi:hypothetical protein
MTTDALAEVEQQAQSIVTQAGTVKVTDASTFQQAGLFLRTVAQYVKKVGEVFDPVVDAAHKAHKVAVEQRKKLLEPAQQAERMVKGEMSAFEAQERARVAAAEAAAYQERRRLEQAREAEAAALVKAGKIDQAARVIEAPVVVARIEQAPQAEGITFREDWDFEVTDAALIPREYLVLDEKKLRAFVKTFKDRTAIPGIRAISKRVASVRA